MVYGGVVKAFEVGFGTSSVTAVAGELGTGKYALALMMALA
jgi:KaiC/GvpD/RAD55 family RecA-like ATPase